MQSNFIFKEGHEVYSCLFETAPAKKESIKGKIIKIEKDKHFPIVAVFEGIVGRQRFHRNGTAKGQEIIGLSLKPYRIEKLCY